MISSLDNSASNDLHIVNLIYNGAENEATKLLMREEYKNPCLKIGMKYGLKEDDIASIYHDVIIVFISKVHSKDYTEKGKLVKYLKAITGNKCREWLRQIKKAPFHIPLVDFEIPNDSDEEVYQTELRHKILYLALEDLKEHKKSCYELLHGDKSHLSSKEQKKVFNLSSLDSLFGKRNRCKKYLKRHFTNRFENHYDDFFGNLKN